MKPISAISICFILISFFSTACGKKQPKVVHSNSLESDGSSILNDTTKIQVANLPVSFDSTNVLLHISGFVDTDEINKSDKNKITSSVGKGINKYEQSYFYANELPNNDCIRGWFSNIYFDNLSDNKQQLLTNDALFISDAYYFRKLGKNKGLHYILYSVYDKDSNKDGIVDKKDLSSKYLSKLDGSNFKKITPEGHDFVNGIFEDKSNRYYFITLEDINKDGFFNKNDKYNYYYIDFTDETYSIKTYNPLNKE